MRARSLLFTVWGDTIRPAGGEIGVGSLIRLMTPLDLTPRAVRAAVSRMARQGWLQTRRVGRRAFYSLTAPGEWRVEQGVRRVYRVAAEPWDGHWRLLTYAIPEDRRAHRDRLRRELTWLGLGPLSRGTWLTPRDLTPILTELVSSRGIHGDVAMFEARHLGPSADAALVRRCWNLDAVAVRYREFLAETRAQAASLRRRIRAGRITDAECFAEKILLVHEYRKFLFVDPGLPDELLPAAWPGRDAAQLFRDTYAMLAGPAARFFGEAFERPSYRPLKAAGRLPTNASTPSLASSVSNARNSASRS